MNGQPGQRWMLPLFAAATLATSPFAWSQYVKVTPLGSHTGELCDRDRATIFEDPTGVRILYDAGQSVEITVVPASHASHVPRALLIDPEKKNLEADELTLDLGPPSGYVIKFTNGLVVYLSGDTGIHADMRGIVHDFHEANLAVLNLGPNAVSPDAAAYIINELVKPATVVASHPNEAVTEGGKLLPNSRMKAFIDLVKDRPVYLALSGRTMEFDGNAKCVAGC